MTLRSRAISACLAAGFAVPLLADGQGEDRFTLSRVDLFGTAGRIESVAAGGERLTMLRFVKVDSLGRIVVAGHAVIAGEESKGTEVYGPGVARFLPDGTLDTDFGGDGLVVLPYPGYVRGLDVDSLDRAVVCGAFRDPGNGDQRHGAMRFTADGALDASFGAGGFLPIDDMTYELSHVRADRRDDSLIAFARRGAGFAFVLVRITPAGGFDTAWSGTGFVPALEVEDLAIDAEGGIVAASEQGVQRYLANGTLDVRFGTATMLAGPGGGILGSDNVEIDGEGRIVAFGSEAGVPGLHLCRFLADGAPDNTFSGDGVSDASTGYPGDAASGGLALAATRGPLVRYAAAATLWFYDETKTSLAGHGYFVGAYDPATPDAVSAFVFRRPEPEPGGQEATSEVLAEVAIAADGSAAYAVGSSTHFAPGARETKPILLRVDLANTTPQALPDLRVTWSGRTAVHRSPTGTRIRPRIRVTNTGDGDLAAASVGIWLSRDGDVGSSDLFIGAASVPHLAPGASAIVQPLANIGRTRTAGMRLIARANPGGLVPESDLSDNEAVSKRLR